MIIYTDLAKLKGSCSPLGVTEFPQSSSYPRRPRKDCCRNLHLPSPPQPPQQGWGVGEEGRTPTADGTAEFPRPDELGASHRTATLATVNSRNRHWSEQGSDVREFLSLHDMLFHHEGCVGIKNNFHQSI